MEFLRLDANEDEKVKKMSEMATFIVQEHFDPIIGRKQNDYMIAKFQTVEAIQSQLRNGYYYYFVLVDGKCIGFMAFYPRGSVMYLSKFYLYKEERRKHYSRLMLDFVIQQTKKHGLTGIELNVNRNNDAVFAYEKLGFHIIREEKNDIGSGYYMDDYVFFLPVPQNNQKNPYEV